MLEVIQPLLAPVIMVSAGALIAIAQFGRYTAIVNLIRTLNRERLAYFQQMKQVNLNRFRSGEGLLPPALRDQD